MDQNEKAYQKQDAVFIGSKRLLGKKSKKAIRYWRSLSKTLVKHSVYGRLAQIF